MDDEPIRAAPFVLLSGPAGAVCVDGSCLPPSDGSPEGHPDPEYPDRDPGTGRAEPADAGEEAPSSGG